MSMPEYYEPKEIVGKTVYDSKGQKVGEVEKVVILKDGRGALLLRGTGQIIPVEQVQSVADIILIARTEEVKVERIEPPLVQPPKQEAVPTPLPTPTAIAQTAATSRLCFNCKHENKSSAKFCVKCGVKL